MLNHNARASSPFTFGPHFPLILLIGLGGACLANAFTFMSMKYVIGVCVGLFCVCVLIYFHHYVTQISLFALVSASGMWFQFWILNQKNPRYIYHLGGAQPEPMISLVDLSLFLILGLALYRIIVRREPLPAWTGLDTCILLFLTTCMVSCFNAPDALLAMAEIVRYCKYVMVYMALRMIFDKGNYSRLLMFSWLFILMLEAIVSITQYFFYFRVPFFNVLAGINGTSNNTVSGGLNFIRVSGITGHSNILSTWLLFPLCVSLTALFLRMKPWHKVVVFSCFVLGLVTLVFTFARGGWTAFLVSCISIVCIMAVSKRLKPLQVRSILFFLIFSIITVYVSGLGTYINARITTDDTGALATRPALNKIALRMVGEFPFMGVGINNFQNACWRFDSDHFTLSFDFPPHNIYMLFASEAGIICVIFFIGMGVLLIQKSFSLAKNPHDEYGFFIGASCTAYLIGIMVNQLFEATIRYDLILSQCTLMAALVMANKQKDPIGNELTQTVNKII